jgi:hypothetical protein
LSEWKKAIKKPIEIEYLEVNPQLNKCECPSCRLEPCEWIDTLAGRVKAQVGKDLIIKGIENELYPISKEIFAKTYDVVQDTSIAEAKLE